MHPGQKKYGQISAIRPLRQEIISKMLDGRLFFLPATSKLNEGFYFSNKITFVLYS